MCWQVGIMALHRLRYTSKVEGMLLRGKTTGPREGGNGRTTVPKMLDGRGGS